jgi:hypothetical protein
MQVTHAARDGLLVVSLTGQINLAVASGVDTLDPVCAAIFASVVNRRAGHIDGPALSILTDEGL